MNVCWMMSDSGNNINEQNKIDKREIKMNTKINIAQGWKIIKNG